MFVHRVRSIQVLVTTLTLSALCSAAFAEPTDDAKRIMELERNWSSKFAEKDIDWIAALHAPKARQLPPNAPAVIGTEAIRAAWQGMADTEGLSLTWEPISASVSQDGSMAYDIGRGTQITPDGKSIPVKYVVVWERRDGQWKVVVDMFSPDE